MTEPYAVAVRIPLKTVSEANVRCHWRVKAQRVKNQRFSVAAALSGKKLPPLPAVICMTRIGPRKLDSDNLAISFKACRDEVAKAYGIDDGREDMYFWTYAQQRGPEYGVEISIVPV